MDNENKAHQVRKPQRKDVLLYTPEYNFPTVDMEKRVPFMTKQDGGVRVTSTYLVHQYKQSTVLEIADVTQK